MLVGAHLNFDVGALDSTLIMTAVVLLEWGSSYFVGD